MSWGIQKIQEIQDFLDAVENDHWGNVFYKVPFPLLHTNYPLGKRGSHSLNGIQTKNSEICTKPLRQWVSWGPFSIITYKSPIWKAGITQFEWITSKKNEICTKPMNFRRSLFHYYIQITQPEKKTSPHRAFREQPLYYLIMSLIKQTPCPFFGANFFFHRRWKRGGGKGTGTLKIIWTLFNS